MNDASFSRRDSVGSLVDLSMITSKNPVFHIRLRGCRLVGLREKPRKFRSSSDSLFLCSSLNSGDIINEQFIFDSEVSCWSSKQPDVSEITHRCPSFSGSAWPMHSSRDDLVSELQVGNPDITFSVTICGYHGRCSNIFSKSKCLLPSRTTFMSPRV
ncbi:hypothetical protein TNCV_321581 [Trichonephila clavipes]|nr:hypothetical protein TNCV_321581 [Trichonephila clavipes]